MNTREQMTDNVLEILSDGKRVLRQDFYGKIMGGNEAIPKIGSLRRYAYTSACYRAKKSINTELSKRGTCRQLITIHSKGFRLVRKNEIFSIATKRRCKKEVSVSLTSMQIYGNIVDAKDTPEIERVRAQKTLNYLATEIMPKQLKG